MGCVCIYLNIWPFLSVEECDQYTRSRCCFEWKPKGGKYRVWTVHAHCLKVSSGEKKENWCKQHY